MARRIELKSLSVGQKGNDDGSAHRVPHPRAPLDFTERRSRWHVLSLTVSAPLTAIAWMKAHAAYQYHSRAPAV